MVSLVAWNSSFLAHNPIKFQLSTSLMHSQGMRLTQHKMHRETYLSCIWHQILMEMQLGTLYHRRTLVGYCTHSTKSRYLLFPGSIS